MWLPEDQRRCACGCELRVIGAEESEQLDVIPARIQGLHHIRERYACSGCETAPILAPLPAQPIPKSNASAGLLAHIAVAKYQDGLPLHRQEHILARSGIDLPRQTLARWMIRVAELAQPVVNLLWDDLLSNPVVHCDETTVQVLKEPDKSPTSNSYMWALAAGPPARSVVLFDYDPSRSGEVLTCRLSEDHPKLRNWLFRDWLWTVLLEFRRRQLAEAGVRSHLVVLKPEVFDQDLRIDPVFKPLHVQALVPELAIERFIHSIQPWLSRVDVRSIDVGLAQPLQNRSGDEFWPVVRSEVLWRTMNADKLGEYLNHTVGTKASCNING